MNAEEIGELEILVNKLKFRAGQKASDLHDLIEDRLMTDFEDIPPFAETAYLACKEWSAKNQELLAAKLKSVHSWTGWFLNLWLNLFRIRRVIDLYETH